MTGGTSGEQQRYDMLRAGLDELDQGFTIFDSELRLVAWNKSFLRLLDFPEAMAYPGAPFETFIRYNAYRGEYGPGDPEALIAEIVDLAGSFASHYAERHRPNGRIIAVRGAPLPHHGFMTLYTDVTESRRREAQVAEYNLALELRVHQRTAELQAANARLTEANTANQEITASLQRSEERLRLITDGVPANIGYFDNQQIFRYANKGYSEWFNLPVEAIVGHSAESVLGPEVWPTVAENVAHALTGHRVSYEYSLPRPNGSRKYARSTLVPEFGPDGSVLGCFVLALDVTEQKRTQAALVQAQKMEAIGQLTGGIAHDFNNMLTVVIGNLGVLREQQGRDPATDEFLDSALQAARRGVDIIKRLLAFSRQQPLAPRPIDVGLLVTELGKLIRRSLPESIDLVTPGGGARHIARADPNQLDSALLNLVLNARDAMPHGGRIEISLDGLDLPEGDDELAPGRYVAITVSDTGQGMDSGALARVFEPFFTTKSFGKGSGLGMAMVYGFVKQSGGDARIRSTPGAGTAVTLLLPEAASAEEAGTDDAPGEALAGGRGDARQLVLLVEDDAEVRRIARRQITDLGYPVIEAENGPEALAMIENVPDIAIMLSDIVMPGGIDGWTLARRARALRPGLRVALMSGYAHPGAGEEIEDPDLPLLPKPFDSTQLAAALQRA